MRYHIVTYGCQMNKSDSERIASVLEKIGYQPGPSIDEADLIVVNMCSVRQSAVDRVYGLAQKFKKLKTINYKLKTILTGCILKEDKKKFKNIFDFILDIKALPNWPKTLQTHRLVCGSVQDCQDYLSIPAKYQNNFGAFVPISNGCDNFCSYCVVPFTRGREISRPAEDIICEVKNLIKRGYKEIVLLGQNVNSYKYKIPRLRQGFGGQTNSKKPKIIDFSVLLKLLSEIPGDFQISFLTSHPKDFSDELIEVVAKSRKIKKEIHLPVQSGDNEILRKMKRGYTKEDYLRLVKKIRKKIPDINLSTDVIVGFPGETKKQFENTVKLFKEIKFNHGFVAKYSPRPGTTAAELKDDVPLEEKKRRYKILNDLLQK